MERLGIQTAAGKAKLVGTSICIGGAMVLTFYKGPEVIFWTTNIDLTRGFGHGTTKPPQASNRALGLILALCCCLCYSLWLIVQAKMSQSYPCPLSSTALMCLMGSIQSVIFVMCVDHKWEEWKLGWNIRLLSAAYAGILASGLMFALIAWGVKARGPLFVSVFSPLMLLMVAIMGSLFLGEKLHIGSLVGAALIVVGLYSVLWGKGKEAKRMTPQLKPSKSSRDGERIEVVVTIKASSSLASTDANNNNNNLLSTAPPKSATIPLASTPL
ncbi:WAT1-related protein At1g09380-like [Macadamia integrifolia]|uniref:WAT1-related protein At1g09380-like n=1 Tax=Macadamia integrifolia TaxID=60698 RepID=UPI001C4E45E4|nr:WAT1-related protein At1g09380-like [Macadamia integrifolia]